MRLFWIIIAAFVVVGGVIALNTRSSARRSASLAPESAPSTEPTPSPPMNEPATRETTETIEEELPSTPETPASLSMAVAAADQPLSESPPNDSAATDPTDAATRPEPSDNPSEALANPAPTPVELPPALASLPDPVGTTPAVAATPSPARVERGDEAPVPTVLPGDPPGTIENYEVSPVTFELQDGVLVVDGRYHVRGEGTQANPYRVPWELLTSVGTAFEPREGRKTIPGRVAFLEGKWVRIAGYVSFPLMTRQPRELLAMLNQWDGCCIGVPPTPYDAIEVNLSKALTGNDAFAIAGTVTGEFHIRPYLMGDWLVGLYMMEHGSLQATEFGGPGGF